MYAAEISPKIRRLNKLNEALKDWKAQDDGVIEILLEIKSLRGALKDRVEDKESELIREINDLKTDIKLAVEAAVQGTEYDAADFKAYLVARANEKVSTVVEKGSLFSKFEEELA
jgi:hypothetical protein